LLLLVLLRTTGRPWRSAAVAALFALHPLQVEAVAWAVERKTVLASALGMGAILAYVWYAERPSWRRWLASFVLGSASLLAKPLLVTLPFLLLVLDVWPLGRTPLAPPARLGGDSRRTPWARLVLEKVPSLAAGLLVAVTVGRGASPPVEELPFALRAANAVTSYWAYLGKLVCPVGLAAYYPNPSHVPSWQVVSALAGLVFVTAVLVAARGRIGLAPVVGWCWYLGTLVPLLGLVRSGLWPAMADRFVYFPMAGVLMAMVWGAAALLERVPRAAAPAGAALSACLLVLAACTRQQALHWRSSLALFEHAVRVTTPSRFVWANYGESLRAEGRAAEAQAFWERMTVTLPDVPDSWLNLGVAWHERGDLAPAEDAYRAALARDPRCAQAHYNLGLLVKSRGDLAAALAEFERARQLGLREGQVLRQIGAVAAALGRTEEADWAYSEALRADPLDWRAGVGLAGVRASAGRTAEADAMLREAGRMAARAGEAEVARQAGLTVGP
jgi:Flp pilus assembly protein TadD